MDGAMTLSDQPRQPGFASPAGGTQPNGETPAAAGPQASLVNRGGVETIKAFTVLQPYASLLTSGIKTIETRTWSTGFRGWLLICAGKRELGSIDDLPPALRDRLAEAEFGRPFESGDRLPTGVAVGLVKVVNCIPMPQGTSQVVADEWARACCDPYEPAFGFVCEQAYRIKPFSVKGQQGFFDVPITRRQLVPLR
jgi:hypothetical protein